MQGSFEKSWNSHYKDLRGVYAKRMQCHGTGMALMQPISGADCQPTCCGYFDRNGDWNLIARLTSGDRLEHDDFFEPLEYPPVPATEVDIVWQPRASLGVTAVTVDANAATPEGIPGGVGAEGHIQYSSNDKFGAVLMTQAPVKLRAYNDEALFASWLSRNKSKLYQRYGPELKKYGLWIVTRTYTTKRASISAWMDKKKVSVVSLKAKAAMLGELGEDLDWREKAASKDWSHYQATTEHGVVVFIDGIQVQPLDWYLEGVRSNLLASSHPRGRQLSRYVPDPIAHQKSTPIHYLPDTKSVLKKQPAQSPHAPSTELQRTRGASQPASPDSFPRRPREQSHSLSPDPFPRRPREQSGSLSVPPVRRQQPPRDFEGADERRRTLVADEDILADAGVSVLSRSQSLRKPSITSTLQTHSRPTSLRRDRRSINEERVSEDKQFDFYSADMGLKGIGLPKELTGAPGSAPPDAPFPGEPAFQQF